MYVHYVLPQTDMRCPFLLRIQRQCIFFIAEKYEMSGSANIVTRHVRRSPPNLIIGFVVHCRLTKTAMRSLVINFSACGFPEYSSNSLERRCGHQSDLVNLKMVTHPPEREAVPTQSLPSPVQSIVTKFSLHSIRWTDVDRLLQIHRNCEAPNRTRT